MPASDNSNDAKINAVVQILQKNDSLSIPFAETRSELLDKGYTETEIIQGIYRFPYDGKPNQTNPRDPMTSFYMQHPEAADDTARILLNDLGERERQKLIANSLASSIGDTQTTSYYEVQTADQIGYPYYTVFFITVALGIAGLKYQWLKSLVGIYSFIASTYFGYLWYQHWRSMHRKK